MDRKDLVRQQLSRYETGDRQMLEEILADDFRFWSPPDPGIDRATYWERCGPTTATWRRSSSSASPMSATRCS